MYRAVLLFFACIFGLQVQASQMGDDGLHKAPWMRETFKDLREDLEDANLEGKRLLLLIEQRGLQVLAPGVITKARMLRC